MPTTCKCPNLGNCDKANAHEPIPVPDGGDLACPECGSRLLAERKSKGVPLVPILLVFALVTSLAGAFLILRRLSAVVSRASSPVPATMSPVSVTPAGIQPTGRKSV